MSAHLQAQIDALRALLLEIVSSGQASGLGGVQAGLSLEQYAALVGRAPSTVKRRVRALQRAAEGRQSPDPGLLCELPEFTVPPWGDPYVTLEALRRHREARCGSTHPSGDPDIEVRVLRALG